MTPRKIYRKTFGFVILKLLLQVLFTAAAVGLLYLIYLLAAKTTLQYTALAAILLWMLITIIIAPIVNRFGTYLLRAGHVAAVAATVQNQKVPEKVVNYGIQQVKERFPVATAYFFAHNLVDGAVRQLQKVLKTSVGDISFLVGFGPIDSVLNAYMKIAIGKIDDCCLAYTFLRPKQGAIQAACDGVVIYGANWQSLMKQAAKTFAWAAMITGLLVLIPIAAAFIGFAVLKSHSIWMLPILLVAAYLATSFKSAVVDSYTMVRMIVHYYDCSKDIKLTQEYYDDMSNLSGKFRRLYKAAKKEQKEEEQEKRERKKRIYAEAKPITADGDVIWKTKE